MPILQTSDSVPRGDPTDASLSLGQGYVFKSYSSEVSLNMLMQLSIDHTHSSSIIPRHLNITQHNSSDTFHEHHMLAQMSKWCQVVNTQQHAEVNIQRTSTTVHFSEALVHHSSKSFFMNFACTNKQLSPAIPYCGEHLTLQMISGLCSEVCSLLHYSKSWTT